MVDPSARRREKSSRKLTLPDGSARRSAPRCRFQLSHGVGEANFPIQFPDGSHKGLFMKRSPRAEASANGRQDAREMNGEDETSFLRLR